MMFFHRSFLAFALLSSLAQAPAVAQPPADKAVPVQTVREQIADLVLLQSLVPLKLTAEQIDALLPPMKAASAAAAKLRKQDDDAVKGLATEIAKTHSAALTGTPIPEATEKLVLDADKASAERIADARKTALKEIFTALKTALDDSQKAEVERQSEKAFGGKRVPKQYQANPAKAPKEIVQDLALAAFAERILLFDRAIPLLEKLKMIAPVHP
jgi:hypothetical protein